MDIRIIGCFLTFCILSFNVLAQKAQTLGAPVNTLDFAEFAPTISADGKIMIFESDRGGKDAHWRLYISYLIKGVWSEPKDMEVINNFVERENFLGGPCLSYDGTT